MEWRANWEALPYKHRLQHQIYIERPQRQYCKNTLCPK